MSAELDLVRGVYSAFAAGDVPGVLGALAPDIHWTEAAGGPCGGVYVGPEAVVEGVFMRLATEWEGFSAVPHEFVDGGATIVALGTYSATYRATGKSFSAPFAHVWKIADGQARSFQQYVDTYLHRQPME